MAKNFFITKNASVFPSTYRIANAAGRYTSEQNFTNLVKSLSKKDSFVVSWLNNVLKVVIDGYYFEIKEYSKQSSGPLSIGTNKVNDYLMNVESGGTQLDEGSLFKGCYYDSTKPSSGSYLQVLDADGNIINQGYIDALCDSNGNWINISNLVITDDGKIDVSSIDFSTLTEYLYIAKFIAEGATKLVYQDGSGVSAGNSGNRLIYFDNGYVKDSDEDIGTNVRPVYVSGGVITQTAYQLKSTVEGGSINKLAYYSGTNTIDDYTSTIGSGTKPMYLDNGVPKASSSTVGSKGLISQNVYLNSGVLTAGQKITISKSTPSGTAGEGDLWFVIGG